jgi:hypothetical protein
MVPWYTRFGVVCQDRIICCTVSSAERPSKAAVLHNRGSTRAGSKEKVHLSFYFQVSTRRTNLPLFDKWYRIFPPFLNCNG